MSSLKKILQISLIFLFLLLATLAEALPREELPPDYFVKVKFSQFKLILFDYLDNEIVSFQVALPKRMPNLPIEGWIKEIKINPWWYPTGPTKAYYLKKKGIRLPDHVPPGHPHNAMGKVKFLIKFTTASVNSAIRIHGTNDPSSIGKRITRDCIRLRNEDGLILAEIIKDSVTKVIFEL